MSVFNLDSIARLRRFGAALCVASMASLGSGAHAAAVLTSGATSAGYALTDFVLNIPNSSTVGPVGLMNTLNGKIMLSGYGNGEVRVFNDVDGQTWSNGVAATGNYGVYNPAGLARVGGRYFLALQASGKVVEVDAAGNYLSDIFSAGLVTSVVGNPNNGHLYASDVRGAIHDIDLANGNASSIFAYAQIDGMYLSADGKTLYGAGLYSGHILGFDTATKAQVFDSGYISGGVDGTALGSGSLTGNLFVNTNDGHLIQINMTTLAQTVIIEGGSRGDFVTVDSNNGSLLVTQTDRVLRLTAPAGSSFEKVPEPGSLALLAIGIAAICLRRR